MAGQDTASAIMSDQNIAPASVTDPNSASANRTEPNTASASMTDQDIDIFDMFRSHGGPDEAPLNAKHRLVSVALCTYAEFKTAAKTGSETYTEFASQTAARRDRLPQEHGKLKRAHVFPFKFLLKTLSEIVEEEKLADSRFEHLGDLAKPGTSMSKENFTFREVHKFSLEVREFFETDGAKIPIQALTFFWTTMATHQNIEQCQLFVAEPGYQVSFDRIEGNPGWFNCFGKLSEQPVYGSSTPPGLVSVDKTDANASQVHTKLLNVQLSEECIKGLIDVLLSANTSRLQKLGACWRDDLPKWEVETRFVFDNMVCLKRDPNHVKGQGKGYVGGYQVGYQSKGQDKGQGKGQAMGQAMGQDKGQGKGQDKGQSKGQGKGQDKGQDKGQSKGQDKGGVKGTGKGKGNNFDFHQEALLLLKSLTENRAAKSRGKGKKGARSRSSSNASRQSGKSQ